MTTYYPIVIERETSGAVSAYVPGLPVYAAADTRAKAEQAIRATLAAYLDAHPDSAPTSHVRVARVSDDGSGVQLVGVGALLGAGRSRRKARASQLNGRLGGRPRKKAALRKKPNLRKKHVE
jgi:predicted RNase H-like HicB family nuclease